MDTNTILIIEDDRALREGLTYDLTEEGYRVIGADSIAEAKSLFQAYPAELVILDVNLPDGEGYEFCKWAKKEREKVPVLFLTARDLERDALLGYEMGAEDYVTKPFSMALLRKKIEVILKRTSGRTLNRPDYDDGFLSVAFQKMEVLREKEKVNLTPIEYRILKAFLSNRNRLLTHEMLIEQVWEQDGQFVDRHALAVNINRMRRKIEDNDHTYITNIYGMGYQWAGNKE